jgi:hypothetical protein
MLRVRNQCDSLSLSAGLWSRAHAMYEAMSRNAPSTTRNQTIVPATSKMLIFIIQPMPNWRKELAKLVAGGEGIERNRKAFRPWGRLGHS